MVGNPIREIRELFPQVQMRLMATFRQDAECAAAPDVRILPSDKVLGLNGFRTKSGGIAY